MTRPQSARIAIVDDDAAVRHAMGFLLQSLGRETDSFASGEAFLAAGPRGYAGVIADFDMPRVTGVQLARRLRTAKLTTPILLVSGGLTDDIIAAGRAVGITHFSDKPVSIDQLSAFLAAAHAQAPGHRTPRSAM